MDDQSGTLADYLHRRERFFVDHGQRYRGTLNEPWDILDPISLSNTELERLHSLAVSTISVYRKIEDYLRRCPEELLVEIGIPDAVASAVRPASSLPATLLARLDVASTSDGYKVLECNFDSPGLVVETFALNGIVCADTGHRDPNEAGSKAFESHLGGALDSVAAHLGRRTVDLTVRVCAREGFTRDHDTMTVVERAVATRASVASEYLDALTYDEDGLYDASGERIDVLVRIYPLELLTRALIRHARDGKRFLDMPSLLDLTSRGKLALLGPPMSSILEGKGVYALIWLLATNSVLFDSRERRFIEAHFLETYFDPPDLDQTFVVKPPYGREGRGVRVLEPRCERTTRADVVGHAVYQRFVPLERRRLMTESGPKDLSLVTSVMVVGGEEIGVCFRAGEGITTSSWWVAPACLD